MELQAGTEGLISEQVWEGDDIAERELLNGHASGSARPLVWAHAEYVKLLRSLKDRRVFDTPKQTVNRYQVEGVTTQLAPWRFNLKCRVIPVGRLLRIEVLAPATVRGTADAWRSTHDLSTADSGLGVHFVDLPTDGLSSGSSVTFTFFWVQDQRWEGTDIEVAIEHSS